jgi:hypothetical protein
MFSHRMKRNTLYILGSISFLLWLGVTYYLFLQVTLLTSFLQVTFWS